MSYHYSDESRADDTWSLPDVETFYWSKADAADYNDISMIANEEYQYSAGWYYWYCFPGCMPDSEPFGPFDTETASLDAARED